MGGSKGNGFHEIEFQPAETGLPQTRQLGLLKQ
jgi:hypothetical protein